jgi:hypothetical protein
MWASIYGSKSKSNARRLQELLDKANHSNFIALAWQFWRKVERGINEAPNPRPLPLVRDPNSPDAPPIAPADPRYKEIALQAFSLLWQRKDANPRTTEFLVAHTKLRRDALPTPTMEQLVEECCSQSNIDTCLRKIRADSAAGPDGQHGFCVRKSGPAVAALVRYLITLILLNGNVEPATSSAYLALVLKAGRDPFDAIKGYRPLVIFNHVQALVERVFQRHFNTHINAVRSLCQAAFLPHTTTPSMTLRGRASAEIAFHYHEPRMEASSDAQNFFDNVGLDLQKLLEKACGINEQVSARVLRTTECTTLLANTAGGSICDIPVESGAGQGRALATPKSLAALSIRERFTNMNAAGERFPGRCNTFAQLSNQAYADDESSSNLGPLAPQLTALTQEASTLVADLGLRCPNNPDKSTMSYTVWDAEGAQQHTDGNEIVLYTGPQRRPTWRPPNRDPSWSASLCTTGSTTRPRTRRAL